MVQLEHEGLMSAKSKSTFLSIYGAIGTLACNVSVLECHQQEQFEVVTEKLDAGRKVVAENVHSNYSLFV